MNYAQHVQATQQEQAAPEQVKNSAGGYSFQVDDWKRLERFLILGCEGGSYYASERKITQDSAGAVLRCCAVDPARAVETIASISESGRAPKNDAAVFALALAASAAGARGDVIRACALEALPRVCRIGTHLFHFAAAVNEMRGWGRGLRRAVGKWYTQHTPEDLAFQVAKYGQRDGWSHADLLSLCHVSDATLNPVLRYVTTGLDGGGERFIANKRTGKTREYADPGALPALLPAFEEAKTANESRLIKLIADYGLTHEMIPTQHKNSAAVWEALLDRMPMTAMIRNLAKMTAVGLLGGVGSKSSATVAARLIDRSRLRSARVHPIQMLSALMVYRQGHGERGSLTWSPISRITDALDAGFYESFAVVEPSGMRQLLALDVSGSMTMGTIAGVPGLTPRTGSACMAMVTARVEPDHEIVGFSGNLMPLDISPRKRLDDVVSYLNGLPFDRTDCALPMVWAEKNKRKVDLFSVYTDSETWAGVTHPHIALQRYRRSTGIDARLAVVGMVANNFTIADPNDAGMIDVVGFDTNTPALLSAFAKGEV